MIRVELCVQYFPAGSQSSREKSLDFFKYDNDLILVRQRRALLNAREREEQNKKVDLNRGEQSR